MAIVQPAQLARLRDAQKNVFEKRLQEQEVLETYGFVFRRENIANLTAGDVEAFFRYEFNHRWRNLVRREITTDMERLREGLILLLDDERPLPARLDILVPRSGPLFVPYLGPAHVSAILLVTHPRTYGALNEYTERALEVMGLLPDVPAGAGFGAKYEAVNAVLVSLAGEYNVSLYRLDELLEALVRKVARFRG